MGCYVGLSGPDGLGQNRQFDVDKFAYNRDFLGIADRVATEVKDLHDEDHTILYRPIDFAAWRAEVMALPGNQERFLGMLDVMEGDPNWWICPSW